MEFPIADFQLPIGQTPLFQSEFDNRKSKIPFVSPW
jgi:hypothetical protein